MTALQPYGLALHTTTRELGLAVDNFAGQRRWQTWMLDRQLASHLQTYLQQFLSPQTWGDLGFVAVAQGPGGFTGTRIGVVTARVLAQQLNLPLFGISTLACLAWAVRSDLIPQAHPYRIAVQMPAQRGALYGGIYQLRSRVKLPKSLGSEQDSKDSKIVHQAEPQADVEVDPQVSFQEGSVCNWQLEVLVADAVWPATSWAQQLDRLDQADRQIEAAEHLGSSVIDVLDLAYLAWRSGQVSTWDQVTPFYGQHPVET